VKKVMRGPQFAPLFAVAVALCAVGCSQSTVSAPDLLVIDLRAVTVPVMLTEGSNEAAGRVVNGTSVKVVSETHSSQSVSGPGWTGTLHTTHIDSRMSTSSPGAQIVEQIQRTDGLVRIKAIIFVGRDEVDFGSRERGAGLAVEGAALGGK
jgi:hypothetical protein